ncbi:MAG: methionyl-tRNA formyltransferase [Firmicutes bacterium]|nr:methionyl-tRNA formyltransferase [Bacillota bacterium]
MSDISQVSNEEPLEILKHPDPRLRERAKPVRRVNRNLRRLIERMAKTMYEADGIGLAGPQVGVMERLFVVDIGEGLKEFINPEILEASEEQVELWEGCLSIPGLRGLVPRPSRVRVTALDRHGRRFWVDADGWLARVIQHEYDHLEGVLFLDRALRVVEVPPESRLRVVFFGTSPFAGTVLERMLEREVTPLLVVTQPDRPRGRGQAPAPTPVKRLALEHELDVAAPTRLRDAAFVERLKALEPDVIVTAAYGRILPEDVLAVPKRAAVNVHASLLPRWRGAAPIQRALMAGDERTGVTILHMSAELDAGDIILQKEAPIEPDDDFGSLHEKLAELGAEALLEALRLIAKGEAPRRPQDAEGVTLAPPLRPEEEWIDWTRPAVEVRNHIRALTPWPGARCLHGAELWKIARTELAAAGEVRGGEPGEIVAVRPERGFAVACGQGALWVTELQPAGRRRMRASDFLNGHRLEPGERLSSGAPGDEDA